MAIGMTLTRPEGKYDIGASKFFGTPTIPGEWLEELDADLMFVAQIRLTDIAPWDTENALPHTGYLYFFVESGAHVGEDARAVVRYSPDEPDTAVDDFNAGFDVEGAEEDWLITFCHIEDDADGHKLLGDPCGWGYDDAPELLLQYDPLATEGPGFMDIVDGFGFFFYGEDSNDFSEVRFLAEHS